MLEQRVGDKFGRDVLKTVLSVTHRQTDDDGMEFSQRRAQGRLSRATCPGTERVRWVSAADKVHNANSILSDLRRTVVPDTVWGRFTGGREGHGALVSRGPRTPARARFPRRPSWTSCAAAAEELSRAKAQAVGSARR